MEKKIYKDIQNEFIKLRFYHSSMNPLSIPPEAIDLSYECLRQHLEYIAKNACGQEKDILTYCISTLFEIASEGSKEKIFDYCDAVHNIPEMLCCKSWEYKDYYKTYLSSFRKKYGKNYFNIK
ncbi:MAG: hypothetical protein IJ368_10125 [Oscillospiraceae bacterium]|nr:hypothetical protein [Oscillospiraceae bacterium]